ncbi:hypothetical protein STCU_00063 [Strigomonas culicis]|uniref:Methyltransferase domain-containing protein n=1 Tax=Strigomonas culicis TaxID=28005 RepID=S9VWT7_9TRYP|nr:hypothetical protein STCU_06225 [Strigomonas culicis]EPY28040.1 hypothetical protein STCU_05331 [Strigomonas culicis]EPY37234.1 hypothetical protein STCU_00063 [Strigomonas culicis]|eukprot:EPY26291.1 hypothetical protein STCU_06225 [Strigomonas culicis]
MEPQQNAEYGQQRYWEQRYQHEDSYDWFPSVYAECVAITLQSVDRVYEQQQQQQQQHNAGCRTIKVLHLGTGNSQLVRDLYLAYKNKYPGDAPYALLQVAVDYSPVVIEKMKQQYAAHQEPGYQVAWEVADIRDLADVRRQHGPLFDLVVDKGTMDALQADKNHDTMDEDIDAMLTEVSRCLDNGSAEEKVHREFVQFTWEIPHYRLHYTVRSGADAYAWGDQVTNKRIGDSDMYRCYFYRVNGVPS